MKIIVTGGAGFIGSHVIRRLLRSGEHTVINVDKLTYAGNVESLSDVARDSRHCFLQADICDASAMGELFATHLPDAVMHLAAESHVDRSIEGPAAFLQTNVVGTFNLLQAARRYWQSLDESHRAGFRFLHVSTDEVFGSLSPADPAFNELTPYDPHSPYSASKAASDHFVRAWHSTYGLPVLLTNCSNNYGPYQFPEKLIPVVILKALRGESIPVYGKGENVRDWLYVEDHAEALVTVLMKGRVGETYTIGGNNEQRNIDLVTSICRILDEVNSSRKVSRHEDLIAFVPDRPGHDFRYAIDSSKLRSELGWHPRENCETGLRKTVQWYLENRHWWERILTGEYRMERLGLANS